MPDVDPAGRGALSIIPVRGIAELAPEDDIAQSVLVAARGQGTPVVPHDCLVVTQKIVSKVEARIVPLAPDDLEARAAIIEDETVRVLRRRGELVITETRHGFICANAGVDVSNVALGRATLLPIDSDRSARRIRDRCRALGVPDVAVIVSDTFGRAWRNGLTDVAIGVAGVAGVHDLRGTHDTQGRRLQVSEVAIADEIAGAAELVMGKADGVPVAIVRGLAAAYFRARSSVQELVRDPSDDLFR